MTHLSVSAEDILVAFQVVVRPVNTDVLAWTRRHHLKTEATSFKAKKLNTA